MIGNLLQQARQDAAKIATAGGFTVSAVLSLPDGSQPLAVTGLATGTWMVFDQTQQGKPVNSRSNSFTIPVSQLDAANFPYKDGTRINLLKCKIFVQDGAGMAGTFTVNEQHPNTTLGLIVCLLAASV